MADSRRLLEKDVISGLGVVGGIREANRLMFQTYPKFFMLVQLTLILPLVILGVGFEYLLYLNFRERNRSPVRVLHHPASSSSRLHSSHSGFGVPGTGDGETWLVLAVGVLFSAVALLVIVAGVCIPYQAVVSLSTGTILYAVGLHYTGQNVSFQTVLRLTVMRLWMRLTVTKVCQMFVLVSALAIVAVVAGLSLLLLQNAPLPVMMFGALQLLVVTLVGSVWLECVFTVAASVSVLEKDYGWESISRSLSLLKGRRFVAIMFQLVWVFPPVMLYVFRHGLPGISNSNGLFQFLSPVICILWTSYIWQLKEVCAGIQFASLKAYHSEDLSESMYGKGTVLKGTYEPRYELMEGAIVK